MADGETTLVSLGVFALGATLPQRVKVIEGIYDADHPEREFSTGDVLELKRLTYLGQQIVIEACLVERPERLLQVPLSTDVTVEARCDTYGTMWVSPLAQFVSDHQESLPLVVRVVSAIGGAGAGAVGMAAGVVNGDILQLYRVERREVVLCRSGGRFLVLPAAYGGSWMLHPRRFTSIFEVLQARVGHIRVRQGDVPREAATSVVRPTITGETLQLDLTATRVLRKRHQGHLLDEVEIVKVIDPEGPERYLPLYLGGEYEEVLPHNVRSAVSLRQVDGERMPCASTLLEIAPEDDAVGAASSLASFMGHVVELVSVAIEPCVVARKEGAMGGRAFCLPTHTDIIVCNESFCGVGDDGEGGGGGGDGGGGKSLPQLPASEPLHLPEEVNAAVFSRLTGNATQGTKQADGRLPPPTVEAHNTARAPSGVARSQSHSTAKGARVPPPVKPKPSRHSFHQITEHNNTAGAPERPPKGLSPTALTPPPLPTAKSPAPLPTAKSPAPLPTAKLPAPLTTAKLSAPIQTAKLPAPLTTAKLPAPIQTAKLPAPLTTAKLPAPIQTAKLPAPLTNAKLPAPIQTAKLPAPLTNAKLPAPIPTAKLPAPMPTVHLSACVTTTVSSLPVGESDSSPYDVALPPPDESDEADNDDYDYEEIDEKAAIDDSSKRASLERELYGDYEPPVVVVPHDGDLRHFSVEELLKFLQMMDVSKSTLLSCRRDHVSGKDFANLEEDDLERLGLTNPVVTHFHSRSRAAHYKNVI